MLTGGTTAALTVFPLIELNYANAATISINDDELFTENVKYAGDNCEMQAYVAGPKKKGSMQP